MALEKGYVRKFILISELEKLESVIEDGGWDNLPIKAKEALLYEIGFDVKNFKYSRSFRLGRPENSNMVSEVEMIEGSERLDDEWVTLRYQGARVCSDEAHDYAWSSRHFNPRSIAS